ncbi:MAG: hypothetical protein ACK4M6_14390 [Hyphomonas sp.]
MAERPIMNLEGAMLGLVKRSDDPARPILEAVTNSIEAIASKEFDGEETPRIEITLNFIGLLDEAVDLDSILVFDNGIGFGQKNRLRFAEFFDRSKGYNNRGSGRFQFFHRFKQLEIESVYSAEAGKEYRRLLCDSKQFILSEETEAQPSSSLTFSKVTMSNPQFSKADKKFYEQFDIDELKSKIVQTFILRFYLDSQRPDQSIPDIKIKYTNNGNLVSTRTISTEDIPQPESTDSFEVHYQRINRTSDADLEWTPVLGKTEKIHWAKFKLPADRLARNGAFLCSKDIAIESLNIPKIKASDSLDGHRYIAAFYGPILDEADNVSDTVDRFTFPTKQEIEEKAESLEFDPEEEHLLRDEIVSESTRRIPQIFSEYFVALKEQYVDVSQIARAHGISESIAEKLKTKLSDDEETITRRLYEEHSKQLAKTGFKVKQVFDSLKALAPNKDEYPEELEKKVSELSLLVDKQNKEELSRYVLRREMVAQVLKLILEQSLEVQSEPMPLGKRRDPEGLIHDLIFKRKSTTETLNDLWVLNEEFLHFEGTSELPLKKIVTSTGELLLRDVPDEIITSYGLKLDRRPDIFLFADEAKCVLIELKAPNVDLSDYLNQLPKYCTLIANFGTVKITSFYCYLIGENFNPLTDLNEYEETVSGDWIRSDMKVRSIISTDRETIAKQQIEIIKLSSLYARAHRRNQSFADRLGIRALLDNSTVPDEIDKSEPDEALPEV